MNKTFSSSKGIAIELKPVSQFKLDTLKSSKEEIEVPTYKANLASGETQFIELDEEIARNKGRLDEWNSYINAKKALDAKYSQKFLELLIWEGVDVTVPDTESEWQRVQEHFGIKVPDEPIARKLHYVYNELLATPEDIGNLMSDILSVSQIDEEAVGKLRNSFRSGVQRKANSGVPKRQRSLENKKPNIQQS